MPTDGVVHVIDDDEAMRDSLAFLFKAAKVKAQVYEGAHSFLERLPRLAGGCVVTDVRMPGMSGIDLLKKLRELKNPMPVIVITGHGDIPLAVEAMKWGASDFLEKPFDDELLLAAVRSAMSRQAAAGEAAAQRLAIEQRVATLSGRERQVLDGLIAGHPNKTIAYDLGISPRTVEIYRANLMTKMDAQSLSELVRMAIAVGAVHTGSKGP